MFSIDDVRVDVGGVPEVDGLSVQSTSNRVALLGCGRGFFEAVNGPMMESETCSLTLA